MYRLNDNEAIIFTQANAGALWYAVLGATCVGLHFSQFLNLSILGLNVILNICFKDQTKLKKNSEMKPTLNVSN